jgi:hypothetical protein
VDLRSRPGHHERRYAARSCNRAVRAARRRRLPRARGWRPRGTHRVAGLDLRQAPLQGADTCADRRPRFVRPVDHGALPGALPPLCRSARPRAHVACGVPRSLQRRCDRRVSGRGAALSRDVAGDTGDLEARVHRLPRGRADRECLQRETVLAIRHRGARAGPGGRRRDGSSDCRGRIPPDAPAPRRSGRQPLRHRGLPAAPDSLSRPRRGAAGGRLRAAARLRTSQGPRRSSERGTSGRRAPRSTRPGR